MDEASLENNTGLDSQVESNSALFTAVYDRLKAMAANQLSKANRHSTLQTTGLVHELFLRLNRHPDLHFSHRAQFFAYAAKAMRHLLADRARDLQRQRAGGQWIKVTLDADHEQMALDSAEAALQLDDALNRLSQVDARAAQVLELRFFAGLSIADIAQALNCSPRSVDRDWLFARAFLTAKL